jgi:hypothetical protein
MINSLYSTIVSLKGFLYLTAGVFAVAAVLLIYVLTAAATVTGVTPASAISLVDGINSGVLGPGEQRWFRFKLDQQGQAIELEKSLTLIYVPGVNDRTDQLGFKLFDDRQLQFFPNGDTSQMINFGAGQPVSHDGNPATWELFWSGWLWGAQTYYLQVVNEGSQSVDFWLFTYNPASFGLSQPDTPAVNQASAASALPIPPAETNLAQGAAPQTAAPLGQNVHKGKLEPRQETWYSFSVADADQDIFEPMALTLVATPDDGNRIHYLTFDVFTADEVAKWSPGGNAAMNNLGGGSLVYRDNNPVTGERVWGGWVVDSDRYYVRILNGADIAMDYWLFVGDVYSPELGS